MIAVPPLAEGNEPPEFDANCRTPGKAFLEQNPDADPHQMGAWWSVFKPDLARHFKHRCGWSATHIGLMGTVDHLLSCGPRGSHPSPHRNLAFEWSNFRYASGAINSLKGTHDDQILDPCEVKEGWFEVVLPNFVLVCTDAIPNELREKAEFTIKTLQLFNHAARWTRWDWYRRYWNAGNPDLDKLEQDAPLVARAVRKAQAAGKTLPDPEENCPKDAKRLRTRAYRKRLEKEKAEPPKS